VGVASEGHFIGSYEFNSGRNPLEKRIINGRIGTDGSFFMVINYMSSTAIVMRYPSNGDFAAHNVLGDASEFYARNKESFRGPVRSSHEAELLLEAADRGIIRCLQCALGFLDFDDIQPGSVYLFKAGSPGNSLHWVDGRRWHPPEQTGDFFTSKCIGTRLARQVLFFQQASNGQILLVVRYFAMHEEFRPNIPQPSTPFSHLQVPPGKHYVIHPIAKACMHKERRHMRHLCL
jgi:hypothetical protein